MVGFLLREGQAARALALLLQLENPSVRQRLLAMYHIEFPMVREQAGWGVALEEALNAVLQGGTPTTRSFAMINQVKVFASFGETSSAARLFTQALAESRIGLGRPSYVGFLASLAEAYYLSGKQMAALITLETALCTAEEIEIEGARIVSKARNRGRICPRRCSRPRI